MLQIRRLGDLIPLIPHVHWGLEVNHVASDAVGCFLHSLRQRWVNVDVSSNFLSGQVKALSQGQLRYELGYVGANHVSTNKFAELSIRYKLDEARGLSQTSSLAVCREWERSNLELAVRELLLRLLQGVAEGSNLRVTEGCARHHHVVAMFLGLSTSNGLGSDDALSFCNDSQLQLRSDVTDGIDTINVGTYALIDIDSTALTQLHAGIFQTVALCTRREDDGDQAAIHGQGISLRAVLGFNFNGHIIAVVLDGGGLVAGHNLDAELLVLLSDFLGDVLILIWKDAVHELHDGDVHAVVSKNISKFHADGASANNHHGIRCFFF